MQLAIYIFNVYMKVLKTQSMMRFSEAAPLPILLCLVLLMLIFHLLRTCNVIQIVSDGDSRQEESVCY